MADTMEAEEVVEELWREIWREMVPNWDMGMGPRPGPWGTEAEEVATAEEERKDRVGFRWFYYRISSL